MKKLKYLLNVMKSAFTSAKTGNGFVVMDEAKMDDILKEHDEALLRADALWQVGIDVKERYRGHGLGTTLVSLLCDRIEALGKTPFYGTVLANLYSQNIALNTGFYPAWVEISSFKREETKG